MNAEEKEYFSQIYERWADDIYRLCLLIMKNKADAEEAVSDTFVRLMEYRPSFECVEHGKAWLLKTASNICRNMHRSSWKKRVVCDDDVLKYMKNDEQISIMEDVLALPQKYREIIYLHYFQGYKASEIAQMTGLKESTVLSRLRRGRMRLKDILIEGGFSYA